MIATEPVSAPATVPRQRSKPLLPLRGVCSLVDKDENSVLELIESGEIAWAFDVALAQRRGRKRELRMLPAAVADYLKGRPCELDQPTVFGLLVPDIQRSPPTKSLASSMFPLTMFTIWLIASRSLPARPDAGDQAGVPLCQRQVLSSSYRKDGAFET